MKATAFGDYHPGEVCQPKKQQTQREHGRIPTLTNRQKENELLLKLVEEICASCHSIEKFGRKAQVFQ